MNNPTKHTNKWTWFSVFQTTWDLNTVITIAILTTVFYVTKEVLQVDKENLVVKSSIKDFLYLILPQIPEKK